MFHYKDFNVVYKFTVMIFDIVVLLLFRQKHVNFCLSNKSLLSIETCAVHLHCSYLQLLWMKFNKIGEVYWLHYICTLFCRHNVKAGASTNSSKTEDSMEFVNKKDFFTKFSLQYSLYFCWKGVLLFVVECFSLCTKQF